MSAYVVVNIDVRDPATYEQYKQLAPAAVAKYGGKYLARGGKAEALEGSYQPKRFVVLEFPSLERAREWWSSPEYAPAKAMRIASTMSDLIVVDGLPPGTAS